MTSLVEGLVQKEVRMVEALVQIAHQQRAFLQQELANVEKVIVQREADLAELRTGLREEHDGQLVTPNEHYQAHQQ